MKKQTTRGFRKLEREHEEAVRRQAARVAKLKHEVDANVAAQAEREAKQQPK